MLTEDTHCPGLQRMGQAEICRRLQVVESYSWKNQDWSRHGHTFVSEDHGVMCIEILAPTDTQMVDAAWVQILQEVKSSL